MCLSLRILLIGVYLTKRRDVGALERFALSQKDFTKKLLVLAYPVTKAVVEIVQSQAVCMASTLSAAHST